MSRNRAEHNAKLFFDVKPKSQNRSRRNGRRVSSGVIRVNHHPHVGSLPDYELPELKDGKLSWLSRSMAWDLANGGPRKFEATYIARTLRRDTSDAMVFGSVFHEVLLRGRLLSDVAVRKPENLRRDDRTEVWQAFTQANQGREILLPKDFDAVDKMLLAIRANVFAASLLASNGPVEHAIRFECNDVLCVNRIDKIATEFGDVVDLKTIEGHTEHAFRKASRDHGHDFQNAWYLESTAAEEMDVVGMVFIAVSKSPPFLCRCYRIDDDNVAEARELMLAKVDEFRVRSESGDWSDAGEKVISTVRFKR